MCASREIEKDKAIKDGKSYYHPQCLKVKNDINEIISLFREKVNPNVVISVLRKVVNAIVFEKNVESGLLLFGLQYYIKNKKTLNYPQGLYYVVQNSDVNREYSSMKAVQLKKEIVKQMDNEPVDNGIRNFGYQPRRRKTIIEIMNGDE